MLFFVISFENKDNHGQSSTNLTLLNNTDSNTRLDVLLDRGSNFINQYISPLICFISFLLNLVCIYVFMSRKARSLVYRYLLANSICDALIVFLPLMRLSLKRSIEFMPQKFAFDLYFNIFPYQCLMMCSGLIKVCLSFERYSRLNRKCFIFLSPSYFKYIILSIVLCSFVLNLYVLYGLKLMNAKLMLENGYFVILNWFGYETMFGFFMIVNLIAWDYAIFLCQFIVNIFLILSIRSYSQKLNNTFGRKKRNATNGMSSESQNNYSFVDEVEEDEVSSNIIITYMNNEFSNASTITTADAPSTPRPVEIEIEMTLDNLSKKKKKLQVQHSIQNTSKMIQMTCFVFLGGHLMYSVMNVLVQVNYLDLERANPFDSTPHVRFLCLLAYLILHFSLGANFVVFLMFNDFFYSLLSEKIKSIFLSKRFTRLT
jgi:hypothetical protein